MMLELAACIQTLESRRADVVSTIDRAIGRALAELKAIAPLFEMPASAPGVRPPVAPPKGTIAVSLDGKPSPKGSSVTVTRQVKYPKRSPVKANGKPAKAPAKPATSGKAAAAFTPGAAILSALGGAVAPLTTKALRTKSGLKIGRFYYTLEKLINEGTVQRLGVKKTRNCTYTLAHQPRSGAAAGTQAAPPAGPSSANGSPHHRVSAAAPGGFEVAWNGTKERNGDAPSLVGDREIRR